MREPFWVPVFHGLLGRLLVAFLLVLAVAALSSRSYGDAFAHAFNAWLIAGIIWLRER
jgi:succinate dehydrogenase/fumarate reductase cytochrome b subunit